jgi:hypothetical protein
MYLVVVGGDGHVSVILVLHFGVCEAVADGGSFQVDPNRITRKVPIVVPDLVRHCRHIMASIALTESVKRKLVVLGVLFEELLKEIVHVLGNTSLIVVRTGDWVGETCASGLVNVQNVGLGVPRKGIGGSVAAFSVDLARPVLAE